MFTTFLLGGLRLVFLLLRLAMVIIAIRVCAVAVLVKVREVERGQSGLVLNRALRVGVSYLITTRTDTPSVLEEGGNKTTLYRDTRGKEKNPRACFEHSGDLIGG